MANFSYKDPETWIRGPRSAMSWEPRYAAVLIRALKHAKASAGGPGSEDRDQAMKALLAQEGIDYNPNTNSFKFVTFFDPDDPDDRAKLDLEVYKKELEGGKLKIESFFEDEFNPDIFEDVALPQGFYAVLLRNAGVPLLIRFLLTHDG